MKYWAKGGSKLSRKISRSYNFTSHVEGLWQLYPSSFANCVSHSSFLGWFHFLSAPLLGRHPIALTWLASGASQHNPSFTTSHNGLSPPPLRDPPVTCLALAASFNLGWRLHHPFPRVFSLILKSKSPQPKLLSWSACWGWNLACLDWLHLRKLWFVISF